MGRHLERCQAVPPPDVFVAGCESAASGGRTVEFVFVNATKHYPVVAVRDDNDKVIVFAGGPSGDVGNDMVRNPGGPGAGGQPAGSRSGHRGGALEARAALPGAVIRRDGARLLLAEGAGLLDVAHAQLGHQPVVRTGQLPFGGSVVVAGWGVGACAALPADGHAPVGLRSVMLVQSGTYLRCLGCDHDAPIARHQPVGPRRGCGLLLAGQPFSGLLLVLLGLSLLFERLA